MDRISRVERRKVWEHSCRRDQQRSSRSLLGIAWRTAQPGAGMDAGGDVDEPLRMAVAGCAARGVGDHDPGGSLPTAAGGRTNHGEKTCSSPSRRVFTHDHGDRRSGASAGGVDLRYAAVVAQKAGPKTGSPGSLHARALSGGCQGGKAGSSRRGAGGGKPRQPAPTHAIGRRWQTPRRFRFQIG